MKQIVILQRGWVVVGDTHTDGEHLEIANASVIRRWGTTKGLGQLALDGPTDKTVVDPAGLVRAHQLAVVMTIDVQNPEKWQ